MRAVRMVGFVVGAAALALACSKSATSPSPSYAGTWHVSVGSLDSGTITPSSFTVTVRQAAANSLAVTMPALTFVVGTDTEVFDSAAATVSGTDTTLFGFAEWRRGGGPLCQAVDIHGSGNTARDTLANASLAIEDTITLQGLHYCRDADGATATVSKQ